MATGCERKKLLGMREKATECARRKGKALSSHLTTEGFAGDKGGGKGSLPPPPPGLEGLGVVERLPLTLANGHLLLANLKLQHYY